MIQVKFFGYNLKDELYNIIRLFFENNDIKFLEEENSVDDNYLVISLKVIKQNSGFLLCVEITKNGVVLQCNKNFVDTSSCKNDKIIERKLIKRETKHTIYQLLSMYTGKNFPWGFLTGIRPAKIVHELMKEGFCKDEILSKLTNYYFIFPEKAETLYEIAQVEKAVLGSTIENSVEIYIGIPFCNTRCIYCSFTSNPIKKYSSYVTPYMDALIKEIINVSQMIKDNNYKVESIYIGGGTPTSIDEIQLTRLLGAIEENFDLNFLKEYTLEAGRPDSITLEKLRIIKESKVNRISINPQTMNDDTLKLIGRGHSGSDVVRAFSAARDIGFNNINMDVIVGLPGEGVSCFKNTMNEISKLTPESITVHTMAVKKASVLNLYKNDYQLTQYKDASEMVDIAGKIAAKLQMRPYYMYRQKNICGNLENIGYSKKGFEGIYNIKIMEEKDTIIALGAGAVTKVVYLPEDRIERTFNVKSVEEYISRVDEMIDRKKVLF